MSELKIKIKERLVQQRQLSIEEQSLWTVRGAGFFDGDFVSRVADRLTEIGLIEVVPRDGPNNDGLFLKYEKSREATPLERWAYYYLESTKQEFPTGYNLAWQKYAENILMDKEIILELVE